MVIGLNAVIVTVTDEEPRVLTVRRARQSGEGYADALPSGPFIPEDHRTLELGVRQWVGTQTDLTLGYVEQLYTFGDQGRDPREQEGGPRFLSVGYLALVREAKLGGEEGGAWLDWYRYFPWEDWRHGRPALIDEAILPALKQWAQEPKRSGEQKERYRRVMASFGDSASGWNEELVLDRYELLYEAGLVDEALRDRNIAAPVHFPSTPMALDHRRILATAMGRLRGKIKYRPLVFELMPPVFTLLQLQKAVEALAGTRLHKQNFRRLVEKGGLVEGTGKKVLGTGGRPAEAFRFRQDVVAEHASLSGRLPALRG
ncbi:MAG: NUDIX hydrolase [Magnetospiraceae bacterium]